METADSQPDLSDSAANATSPDDTSTETNPSPLSPPSVPPETTSEPAASNSILNTTAEPMEVEHKIEPTTDQTLPKNRRRRKKQFPEMISSAAAVNGLRVLHPHHKSTTEKSTDDIEDNTSLSNRRRRRMNDLANEVDVEALIAISVVLPVDSLTEKEIEANVVSRISGTEQSNYIVVRNHIPNVDVWLTKDHALESIRIEHRSLVNSAYSFLLHRSLDYPAWSPRDN